jgi:PEP-CTERM motif-containing protein
VFASLKNFTQLASGVRLAHLSAGNSSHEGENMDRSTLSKAARLLVLLTGLALLVAPSTDAGTVGGFGGIIAGFGGFGGFGGGFFGGFGGDGGGATSVPQPSSLLLTAIGLGVAVWGAWRNRR